MVSTFNLERILNIGRQDSHFYPQYGTFIFKNSPLLHNWKVPKGSKPFNKICFHCFPCIFIIFNYKTITVSLDNSLGKLKFKFRSQKFVIQMIRYIKISVLIEFSNANSLASSGYQPHPKVSPACQNSYLFCPHF